MNNNQNTTWNFSENLPQGVEQAARETFEPVWASAALSMGSDYDWRNLNSDGWYSGLGLGEVSAADQAGNQQTWDAYLVEAGGIMQSAEGTSRWQLMIRGQD